MIICPSCGKEITLESKFCPECGSSFEKTGQKENEKLTAKVNPNKKTIKRVLVWGIIGGITLVVALLMNYEYNKTQAGSSIIGTWISYPEYEGDAGIVWQIEKDNKMSNSFLINKKTDDEFEWDIFYKKTSGGTYIFDGSNIAAFNKGKVGSPVLLKAWLMLPQSKKKLLVVEFCVSTGAGTRREFTSLGN